MDGQSGETQYEPIIEQCRTRIQHYDTLENWLLSIQQSGFDAESISTVRDVARERRLSAITRQVREDLSVQQGNQDNALRPVLEILAALNLEDEYVYDTVLLVCDTAEPKNLESALATVRYCQSRAEQALRMVPELVARQPTSRSIQCRPESCLQRRRHRRRDWSGSRIYFVHCSDLGGPDNK